MQLNYSIEESCWNVITNKY